MRKIQEVTLTLEEKKFVLVVDYYFIGLVVLLRLRLDSDCFLRFVQPSLLCLCRVLIPVLSNEFLAH